MRKVLEYFTNLWYHIIRKIGSGNMGKKYNALDIAKYLICKFNNENKTITQLKLQKLSIIPHFLQLHILYFLPSYHLFFLQ